jgi:signal transduction histidine kinase/type II secretory pathway pseudopilin PulG
MPVRWNPSVRTRHLTICIVLVLLMVAALASFALARLVSQQLSAKRRAIETLTDQLTQFAQAAILNRAALNETPPVVTLLQATTGETKDFAYCLLINKDGQEVAAADPQSVRQSSTLKVTRIVSFESLERARWLSLLWNVWRGDYVIEAKNSVSLDNQPFLTIVAGIPVAKFRRELAGAVSLILISAAMLAGLGILIATFSGGFVLLPLRELMKSIEQLEAETNAQAEAKQPVPNQDMQNVAQRLRELGRRFAGSRTEVETIRDQLQQLVGNLTERVLLLDREQRILLASAEAEKLLMTASAANNGLRHLRGSRLSEALSRQHPLTVFTEKAYQTNQSLQETAELPAVGKAAPQTVLASLQLFQDRGQPAGALLTLRDFATIQRLETQLDFAGKVAALNRISAGVAHEVKNPLHSMVLHLELLTAKLDAGLDPQQHLEILTSEVNRLTRVVQTFLDFTRPVEVKLIEVDANTLLREVVLLAADLRAQGIDLTEQYGTGPLFIKADPDLLKQALLNIIINACQAMSEGGASGKLIVATGRTQADQQEWVWLSIADNGPGIRPEVREKIFNLYFTTKPSGSGIGLAQTFRAVQLHNGRIELDTELGRGTTFTIQLPKA